MTYQKALKDYLFATNTHEFTNVQKVLDCQAVFWFSDRTCTTLPEIKRYFENAWERIKEEKYSAKEVKWVAVEENTATCLYTYHWEGFLDNQFVSGSGRATNIFVKDEKGNWKLVHEHLSGNC